MIVGDTMLLLVFLQEKHKTRAEIEGFVKEGSFNWREDAVEYFDALVSNLCSTPEIHHVRKLADIDRLLACICDACMTCW